jgi:hypothetical protein
MMMRDGTDRLSTKQEKALVALVTAPSVEAAAEIVGVTRGTLHRWIREDVLFQVEYREARRAALDGAVAQLQLGATEAVEVLRKGMQDRNIHARIRSASKLIDLALKAHDQFDVETRLAALEEHRAEENASW